MKKDKFYGDKRFLKVVLGVFLVLSLLILASLASFELKKLGSSSPYLLKASESNETQNLQFSDKNIPETLPQKLELNRSLGSEPRVYRADRQEYMDWIKSLNPNNSSKQGSYFIRYGNTSYKITFRILTE